MIIRSFALAATSAVLLAVPADAAPSRHIAHKVIVKKTVTVDGTTRTVVTGDPAAKAIVAGCGEKRFETKAEVDDGAGHKRLTKIKLCAKPGEDDAAWLKSLRSAAATIKDTASLPPASRTKIVADLDAEIARIEGSMVAKPASVSAPSAPPVTK